MRSRVQAVARPHPELTRLDLLLAFLVAAGALALYVRTLYPGLLPGDSGEFQALARLLGNTHPTGYQVYLLLAYPLTWLPVGDVAYRVNLFSAVAAAILAGEVYLSGRLLTGRRWPALFASAALAVSATLWSHALIAEVYAPAGAFLAAVLLALLYWDQTGRRWALWAAGVLGGLSLGVHLTVALAAPAVVLYLWLGSKGDVRTWRIASLGALIGAVVSVGTFLAFDALDRPADFIDIAILPSRSVWGLREGDLDSPLERLVFSLAARQWRDRMFIDPARLVPENLGAYVGSMHNEFSWLTILVAVVGAVGLWRQQRRRAVLLLGTLLCQWVYTFNYDIHDIYVFHIPGYVVIALLAACGAGLLADLWARRQLRGWPWRALSAAVALGFCALAVWPTLAPRLDAVRRGDVPSFPFDAYPVGPGQKLADLKVRISVKYLPENAIVFANWRELYPYYYAAHIEQGRTDLSFLEEKPYRPGPQGESSMLAYVDEHLAGHAIYFSQCLPELADAGFRCRPVSTGATTLYQVLP